jgi:hypothetical protein
MLWVTYSFIHVDRDVLPSLVTRFIDCNAEFLFIPKNQIDQVSKETDGIPLDSLKTQ